MIRLMIKQKRNAAEIVDRSFSDAIAKAGL
jgi:hypothetical protein